MPEPLFAFDDVVVRVGERTILDHVTAEVPDQGITAVVGASGSGKSTLLRLCNRLEVPDEGVVRFRGDDVAALDPLELRRRVGMVFQRPTPFPGTVRDNLAVANPAAGDAALDRALSSAALDATFLDRVADDLSGGEQQRVCLARALVAGPEVLLMDEPTSSLDGAATEVLEAAIGELVASGMRVLWVTHDPDQAARLGANRLVVDAGKVRAGG